MRSWRRLAVAVVSGLVAGCAVTRSYEGELVTTLGHAASGNVAGAITQLEANNRTGKDLLYYFELGMLERMRGRYDESQKAGSRRSNASSRGPSRRPTSCAARRATW